MRPSAGSKDPAYVSMTSGTAGLSRHVDTMAVMPNRLWLLVAGYLTWIVCGIPGMIGLATGEFDRARAMTWIVAFIGFGVAFTLCKGSPDAPRRRGLQVVMLGMQSVCGLALFWTSRDGLPGQRSSSLRPSRAASSTRA